MAPKLYTFTVEGSGAFPIDMLRYDRCWPRTEVNSHKINKSMMQRGLGKQRVELSGINAPTIGRWDSFQWKVVEVNPVGKLAA